MSIKYTNVHHSMWIAGAFAIAIGLAGCKPKSVGNPPDAGNPTEDGRNPAARSLEVETGDIPSVLVNHEPAAGKGPAYAMEEPRVADADAATESSRLSYFEKRIRPVLATHCYDCHSSESGVASGGLRVDTRLGLLKGGITGPAVVPGSPAKSLILAAIRHTKSDLKMPPEESGDKLPDTVAVTFEKWIEMGAPDPRTDERVAYDAEAAKTWWAFQPVVATEAPEVKDASWPITDIDRFILASLEQRGLNPAADAGKSALLRRVYLDLTGLPPSPAEQDRFLTSSDPRAFEHVVDDLLARRLFGERWGRHWLDVARYAETTGRDVNLTMPEAWRYRDYIIRSFNEDVPFDQFIRAQLAGDLLPAASASERASNLTATGFLAVGPKGLNETDPRQFAVELADEQIDAVSQAFLGMTISCARCHDHEFDPVTQRDYTALAGIFLSTNTHYGTPGGVRGRNASDLIEAPADRSEVTRAARRNTCYLGR